MENTQQKIKRNSVFAHYDQNNIIQEYVIYYLKELAKVTDNIIFVSDCDLPQKEIEKINKITKHIIVQKHGEYDFGSYKRGYLYLKENNLLNNCDELIFCNDSCYGPLYSFNEMFDSMKAKTCDFWGVTYNPNGLDIVDGGTEYVYDYPHVQSFFLVFKPQVFNSEAFSTFIQNIKKEENKWDVIINYEIGLTEYLNKKGFKEGVYCNLTLTHTDAHIKHYLKLILKDKCPFVKTSIVKNKKYTKYLNKIIKKYTKYNTGLIVDNLKNILQNIFSIRNHEDRKHKIITIFGVKIKIKYQKLAIKLRGKKIKALNKLLQSSNNKLIDVYFDHSLGGGTETYFNNQLSELTDDYIFLRIQYFLYNNFYNFRLKRDCKSLFF